jgi:hypothetical protein
MGREKTEKKQIAIMDSAGKDEQEYVSQVQREEGDHESSNEKSSSACLWISFELRTLVVASCIRFRGLYSICDSDYFSIEHHNRIRYTSIGSCPVL